MCDCLKVVSGEPVGLLALANHDMCPRPQLFQIWINLPKASKMVSPSFKMLWAEELSSKVIADGQSGASAEVVLVAGHLPGFAKPPAPPVDSYAGPVEHAVLVVTLKLAAGASWTLPAYSGAGGAANLNRNAYFYAGSGLSVGAVPVDDKRRIRLRADADIAFRASADAPCEVLILQGRDIGEKVVQHGPFVGNSQQDIMQAFSDYQRDGFGRWPWESDALVFPRERERFAKHANGTLVERPMPRTANHLG